MWCGGLCGVMRLTAVPVTAWLLAQPPSQTGLTEPSMSYNTGEERLFRHDKANTHKGVNPDRKSLSYRLGSLQVAGTCPMCKHTLSSFRKNCSTAGEGRCA